MRLIKAPVLFNYRQIYAGGKGKAKYFRKFNIYNKISFLFLKKSLI